MSALNPLLDAKYLHEIYGDDVLILQIMFEAFLKNSIPVWDGILNVIQEKDFAQVCSMIHHIKPSFSMVGLNHLHPKIQAFEVFANSKPAISDLILQYQTLSLEIKTGQNVIEEELLKVA